MMVGMIGQHMKLTGGKGIIAVWDLGGDWAEGDSRYGKMTGDCRIL